MYEICKRFQILVIIIFHTLSLDIRPFRIMIEKLACRMNFFFIACPRSLNDASLIANVVNELSHHSHFDCKLLSCFWILQVVLEFEVSINEVC